MKMPTIFLGHGSPMNAIADNNFTKFLTDLPKTFPKPRSILMVSAHWETKGTKVLKHDTPKTIHDFGGFPQALFDVRYPAPGLAELSDRISKITTKFTIETDSTWGLDHGTWSVLKFMYPEADVPVIQLSLDRHLTMREHLDLAHELKPLRDEGVLILGSGNITHNLRQIVWNENADPLEWAVKFDSLIYEALLNKDDSVLLREHPDQEALWNIAQPSIEHYLPLLYVYGASMDVESAKTVYEEMQMGSLSMRSIQFG